MSEENKNENAETQEQTSCETEKNVSEKNAPIAQIIITKSQSSFSKVLIKS